MPKSRVNFQRSGIGKQERKRERERERERERGEGREQPGRIPGKSDEIANEPGRRRRGALETRWFNQTS